MSALSGCATIFLSMPMWQSSALQIFLMLLRMLFDFVDKVGYEKLIVNMYVSGTKDKQHFVKIVYNVPNASHVSTLFDTIHSSHIYSLSSKETPAAVASDLYHGNDHANFSHLRYGNIAVNGFVNARAADSVVAHSAPVKAEIKTPAKKKVEQAKVVKKQEQAVTETPKKNKTDKKEQVDKMDIDEDVAKKSKSPKKTEEVTPRKNKTPEKKQEVKASPKNKTDKMETEEQPKAKKTKTPEKKQEVKESPKKKDVPAPEPVKETPKKNKTPEKKQDKMDIEEDTKPKKTKVAATEETPKKQDDKKKKETAAKKTPKKSASKKNTKKRTIADSEDTGPSLNFDDESDKDENEDKMDVEEEEEQQVPVKKETPKKEQAEPSKKNTKMVAEIVDVKDEKGYWVPQKVWKEVEIEDEPTPVASAPIKKEAAASKPSTPAAKKKSAATSSQQSSITNFFKKK